MSEIKMYIDYTNKNKVIDFLKQNDSVVTILKNKRIVIDNVYYKMGFIGTAPIVYTRVAINKLLLQALDLLPKNLGFIIYDAFRSKETQLSIFDSFIKKIKADKPHLSISETNEKAKKYAAHPDEKSIYLIPPHNSGGSIDLAIFKIESGKGK